MARLYRKRKMVVDPSNAKRRRLRKARKSVRFASSTERGIATVVASNERVTSEEVKHVWWTPEEIGHIHRRERSMVGILATLCIPYVQQLDRLVELSGSDTVSAHDHEAPLWIAQSSGRGLEPEVMHILDANNHNAKRVISLVLDTQRQLRESYGDSNGSLEIRNEILSAQYAMLSQRKARMAQLLAAGDAKVAQVYAGAKVKV